MKKLILTLFFALLLASCASRQNVSNLSFVDVTLNYTSEDFEIVDLKPITRRASSFLGTTSNDVNSAILDRSQFNSGSGASNGTATMITGGLVMFITGATIPPDVGPGIFLGSTFALIWGVCNDIFWSNTVRNKAIQRCNYALQEMYPMYDSYINPKYEIQHQKSPLSTYCNVTLRAQGVRLKNKTVLENPMSNNNNAENINSAPDTTPAPGTSLLAGELLPIEQLNNLGVRIKDIASTPQSVTALTTEEQEKFILLFKEYFRAFQVLPNKTLKTNNLVISIDELGSYYDAYLSLQ
mgnify:CR=1 FL=1